MKKIIFTLALTTLVGGATLSSCQSSATKVKNAEKTLQKADSNVVVAKANLNATRQPNIKHSKKHLKKESAQMKKALPISKLKWQTTKRNSKPKMKNI
jgi:hypothetical protein